MHSSLPPPVQTLLELFDGPLRDVRFPQADGAALGAAAEDLHAARVAVAHAEAVLEAARVTFQDKESQLTQLTQRALAYARVYAQDNPSLLAALPEPARGAARAKRRVDESGVALVPQPAARRGRPRKVPEETAAAE
jgi:DNA-directed RNA polymerase subunit F